MSGWIAGVGTAVPPIRLLQEDAKRLAARHFRITDIEKYLPIFDHALVQERRLCVEPEKLLADMTLKERNDLSLEWATRLAAQAIADCVARAALSLPEVDALVFVSSSGIATPSLDSRLANDLGLSRRLRRVPLFGLGCAGGAAGLAIAAQMLDAPNLNHVLVVAVEVNSLTFQKTDLSKQNLVAAAIFGDGAAAVLMSREKPATTALRHVASTALRWPDSIHLMGWEFGDTGFRVVFSNRVPDVVSELVPEMLKGLAAYLGPQDALDGFVLHPGGARILRAFERLFGRESAAFRDSYAVLARYGNMSSATVLFVLAERLARESRSAQATLLLGAFGPGFVGEASLLRWDE